MLKLTADDPLNPTLHTSQHPHPFFHSYVSPYGYVALDSVRAPSEGWSMDTSFVVTAVSPSQVTNMMAPLPSTDAIVI